MVEKLKSNAFSVPDLTRVRDIRELLPSPAKTAANMNVTQIREKWKQLKELVYVAHGTGAKGKLKAPPPAASFLHNNPV